MGTLYLASVLGFGGNAVDAEVCISNSEKGKNSISIQGHERREITSVGSNAISLHCWADDSSLHGELEGEGDMSHLDL